MPRTGFVQEARQTMNAALALSVSPDSDAVTAALGSFAQARRRGPGRAADRRLEQGVSLRYSAQPSEASWREP